MAKTSKINDQSYDKNDDFYEEFKTRCFKWKKIDDIFVSQHEGNTCLLASFSIILRYYNLFIKESDIINILKYENFNLFRYGTYLPIVGVIALKLGINSSFRTNTTFGYSPDVSIISNNDLIRTLISDDALTMKSKEPRKKVLKIMIRMLDLGGKIFLHQPNSPPSYLEIKNAIAEGRSVIALSSARGYYNIDEDWNHALALIPDKEGKFKVFDCFKELGYCSIPNWDKHLDYSRNFDWEKWNGSMIEFDKLNP